MKVDTEFISHKNEVLSAMERAQNESLTRVGMRVTKYAKALSPVGTPESTGIKGYIGGTLRNSIDYRVGFDDVQVGSNVEYAPYQELGYQHVSGKHIPAANGGRGYLRPAITDHLPEIESIIKSVFKNYI